MSPLVVILLAFTGWVVLVLFARWVVLPALAHGLGGDPAIGLLWRLARLYCRLVHRTTFRGEEAIRNQVEPGALIVVANHSSAVDPVLIQAACRFQIRWLMAADMMIPELDWLWNSQQIIPVARDGTDSRPLREAIRHIRTGGVIGIFPEGGIVEPRCEIRPFLSGVGFLVSRSKAPVLLAWVSGTPETDRMSDAFVSPSRSSVEFLGMQEFVDVDDPEEVTERLRRRLAELSGWPLSEKPMPGARRVGADDREQPGPESAILPIPG